MKLDLPLETINYILSVLGKRPFEECFQVIAEIKKQAQAEMDKPIEVEKAANGD